MKAPTGNSKRQSIDRHGKEITLKNFDVNEDDDYGPAPTEAVDSPHTITARTWTTRRSQLSNDNREMDTDIDRYALIKDDASGVSNLSDGGGRSASRIVEDGREYYVVFKNKYDDGTIRLECRSEL